MCASKYESSELEDSGFPTVDDEPISSVDVTENNVFEVDASTQIVTGRERQSRSQNVQIGEVYGGPRLISYDDVHANQPIKEEYLDHHPTPETQPPGNVFFQIGGSIQTAPPRPNSGVVAAQGELVLNELDKNKIKNLQAKVAEKNAETERLERELTNLKQTQKRMEGELIEKNKQIEDLKAEVKIKEDTIQQYKHRLSEVEKQGNEQKNKLEAKISELENELESVKSKHDKSVLDLTNEKHKLELEVSEMKLKHKSLECDIERAKKETADLKATLENERRITAEEKQRSAEERLRKIEEEKDAKLMEAKESYMRERAESEAKYEAEIAHLNRQISQLSSGASLTSQQSVTSQQSLASQQSSDNPITVNEIDDTN